ncbi:MAG: (4Fe-4S)-binding protein [Candidatus Thorarchaeota archaeon]|nr:MAG: (4Fe-4S)-binding protein [Candidatus Thorarchaeota archaeon]
MVKEIAIISGKGGTGKTSVVAGFASLAENIILADCDVDAPDLHILLQPDIKKTEEFQSSKVAQLNPALCTECGLCEEHCRFNAAHPPEIDSISCEGCGVCEYVCPEGAIQMVDKISGHLFESRTRFGPMSHAKLLPGEGNSGLLVTEVRKQGEELARSHHSDIILIDGSPGIGCPVIATIRSIDLAIIVTEPTMSGIHDMSRVLQLADRFNVPSTIIINKYDLSESNTQRITDFCNENNLPLLGKIPFDPIVTKSMLDAKTLPEHAPTHAISLLMKEMWDDVIQMVL